MPQIDIRLGAGGRLAGQCEERFEGVMDAFQANFEQRGEAGA
jgi:hypothetical protein